MLRELSSEQDQMRAGSRALSIFARSLSATVLRAHVEGPKCPSELEKEVAWAAPTSIRTPTAALRDIGALTTTKPTGPSRGVATELSPAGFELLGVADALERWLESSPQGPIALEDTAGRGTIRILAAGWDSAIVRALAERSYTLTSLSAVISKVNYPALKRRMIKLRSTSLIDQTGRGKGTTYMASDWLRRSAIPLTAAARWERRHDDEAEPISKVDVEAAFLMTLPLVELTSGVSGTCAFAVMTSENRMESGPELAGVAVEVKNGNVVSCSSTTSRAPDTWALGTTDAWLDAVMEGDYGGLGISGAQPELPREIVAVLHSALF